MKTLIPPTIMAAVTLAPFNRYDGNMWLVGLEKFASSQREKSYQEGY